MRIAIVGGGSIGLLFASYIQENFNITIYTRTIEQADLLKQRGLSLYKQNDLQVVSNVNAEPFSNWNGEEELSIITVKQYDIAKIVEKIVSVNNERKNTLLFLQNGMGHVPMLKEITNFNIYLGVVEHGALRIDPVSVRHTGIGQTKIAPFNKNEMLSNDIFSTVNNDFKFTHVEDYEQMLIEKLIVNIMINPLTALLQVQNGKLIKNAFFYKTFQQLFAEVIKVFEIEDPNPMFNHVVEVCEKTSSNYSSMYKDFSEGRESELDAILGYALNVAEKKGVTVPIMSLIYNLLKGISTEKGKV